jgi:hypothetical protein
MPEQNGELSWQVASHSGRERTNDWYWGLGAIAIVGVIASILFGNPLLAVILGIGAFSIGFLALQPPREHSVIIGVRGVSIDGTRYPYKSIHSFWVEHTETNPRLFVSLNGILAPHFSLHLSDTIEADDVRHYLKKYVAEEEQGPHFGEHVAEIFGLD